MVSPERAFFRYVGNEESFTDFFVSLLARADTVQILNTIHEDLEFYESAEVAATQRDGLPESAPENETRRTLDWVVSDNKKLVGYESKRGSKLDCEQLKEERRKLQHNAGEREVYLFAVTEDLREPVFDANARWMNWFDIGASIIEIENKSGVIEIMADLFKDNGFERFTGFTDYERDEEWFLTHQNEAVNLAFDAAKYARGLTLYTDDTDLHNRIRSDLEEVKNKSHRGLGPAYYTFSVHPEGYNKKNQNYDITHEGWDIQIEVPALHNEVFVGLNAYLSKDDDLRLLFEAYSEDLIKTIQEEEMLVKASWNSLVNEAAPTTHTDQDELLEIFENKAGEEQYKRLRIGWEVGTHQSPDAVVKETAKNIERIHGIFFDGIEQREDFTASFQ